MAEQSRITVRPPDTGTVEIAFVLLVLQSAFGFVSALGMLALAAATGALPAMGGGVLFAFAVPAVILVLAFGVARLHRSAWIGALVFEGFDLLGALFRLAIHAYSVTSLVGLTVNLLIPAVVVGLLVTRRTRAAIAGRTAEPVVAQRDTNLRDAA
jgi:hypothetical protein